MPRATLRVTMECAGNGRGQLSPRYPSVPWLEEGVSTADWTGVPLARVAASEAALEPTATRDRVPRRRPRLRRGVEHHFARSLSRAEAHARRGAARLRDERRPAAAAARGAAAPGRAALVRHGEREMAAGIEAVDRAFDGFQQARGYHFRTAPDEKGEPCTLMRVNCLMAPPGIPDFYSRRRAVEAGQVALGGRAWSGARADRSSGMGSGQRMAGCATRFRSRRLCWRSWSAIWDAAPGEHELACRATDETATSSRSRRRGTCRGSATTACNESA